MRRWRIYTIVIVAVLVVMICQMQAVKAENKIFKSQGRIVYTNGTPDTIDDVVFDSADFKRLAAVCR